MPINLQELRSAVINYVDTKVTVSISAPISSTGPSINPNEEFSFTLTARNADAAAGGIVLKSVIWRVWVQNAAIGKLFVPAAPMVARSGLSSALPALPVGSQVGEMYLFPPSFPLLDAGNNLAVGDTDTIALRGKAGSAGAGGNTPIYFKIYADADMDWLFPKSQDSSTPSTILHVVG